MLVTKEDFFGFFENFEFLKTKSIVKLFNFIFCCFGIAIFESRATMESRQILLEYEFKE